MIPKGRCWAYLVWVSVSNQILKDPLLTMSPGSIGGIGRNLKRKAEAFSMKVIYHNRRRLSSDLAGNAKYVSFDELLSTSDVISLNLPLNVRSTSLL